MTRILRSPTLSPQARALQSPRSRRADGSAAPTRESDGQQTAPENTASNLSPENMAALIDQTRQNILAQVKAETESAREMGRQRGLREGRQAGAEEIRQEMAGNIAQLKLLFGRLDQVIAVGVSNQEDLAVTIAFEALCKILGEQAAREAGIAAIVRQTAAAVSASESLVVRLHPADLALLQEGGAIDDTLALPCLVSWVADRQIELGGCVIETASGGVDGRLETQLERLRGVLNAVRSERLNDRPAGAA